MVSDLQFMKPGIYFALPEAEYHANPSFSASGAKNMLVSPLTYWINSALNPDRQEKDTDAFTTGKAFDCRIIEGPAAFGQRYAVAPDKEDYPDAIMDGAGLRARCGELGLVKVGSNSELCDRILEVDPEAELWWDVLRIFNETHAGKVVIKSDVAAEISRQARIVELHDSARKAFAGGYPQVSVFWVDLETGVPMKCRVDFLKVRATIDLKTFSNPFAMPLDTVVARAVANYRYHVQAAVYCDGVENAKLLYRAHGFDCVHGEVPKEWMDHFADPKPHAFVFVFLETGQVPNVRVREFRQTETYAKSGSSPNLYWQSGWDGYRLAVGRYKDCMERCGPDTPWSEQEPMRPFVDDDFPPWMLG